MNSTRNVSQEELNIACAFVSGQEGEHAKQLHATFCVAEEGKPLKQIPAQHTVFCMLKDAEAHAEAMGEECDEDDAMCLQRAQDAADVFSRLGSCPVMSCGGAAPAEVPAMPAATGVIPQVPHYESFAVIPTLPHVPEMPAKEGTRLHYHGEPVDMNRANGAAYDFETAALRVGSEMCRPGYTWYDGKCRSMYMGRV